MVATHWVPEQAVAVAPLVGQTAQTPPHDLVPAAQVSVQVPSLQAVVPLGSVGQGVQLAPQLAVELLDRQTPEQRW